MSLVEHDHVVEKLSPNRADHSLRVRVLPWRPCCGQDLDDSEVLYAPSEDVTIGGIAVAQEVSGRRVFRERLDDLLRRPGGSGGIGYVEVHDLSARMQQHYEHVEHP